LPSHEQEMARDMLHMQCQLINVNSYCTFEIPHWCTERI